MSSIQDPTPGDARRRSSKLDPWKVAMAIVYGVVMAPVVALTLFFVLPAMASMVLALPMYARSFGTAAQHSRASGQGHVPPPPLAPVALPQAGPA